MNKVFIFVFISFGLSIFYTTQASAQRTPPPVIIRDMNNAPSVPNIGRAPNNTAPAPVQPQPQTQQRGFAKATTQMNEKNTPAPEDNGYVPSFITGTKIPLNMMRLGGGVSVVTSTMIEEMRPSSIADILRIVPGVIIIERGTNFITASIQGAPSNETNVMIDGISIVSPASRDNSADLSSINLNMDSIERIEIIRLPASIGSGYGASGGVINIITKNGEEQDYTAALYGEMLFNLENKLNGYKAGINLAGSKETFKYGLAYNRIEEIGISDAAEWYGNGEKDGNGSNNLGASFTITPIKDFSSSVYINYTDFYKEYDNGGGRGFDNTDYKFTMERVLFAWDISYKVKEIWEPSLKLTYKYINERYKNWQNNSAIYGNGKYLGQQVALTFNNNFYIVDEFKLSAGAEYIYDEVDIRENDGGIESRINDKTINGANAYIQATIDLFDAWTTIISAKGNVYSEYGYIPTYGISSGYFIEPAGLTIKAAFGVGAKTPTIYERYDSRFGNVSLQPEESMSYEVGFSNTLFEDKLIWGGSWFENYYKNLITEGDNNRYKNEGKAHTYGVEASIRVNPVEFMSIYGSYTWLNAFSLDDGKKRIERMPEHSMVGGVIFRAKDRFIFNASVNYVSDRDDTFFSPAAIASKTTLQQYYLLNVALTFNATQNFQIYLTGTNLMDTRYESSAGYGTRGFEVAVGVKARL